MWWVYLLPLLGIVLGLAKGLKLVRRERELYAGKDALVTWDARPFPVSRQAFIIALWEWVHSIGILVLIVLMAIEVSTHASFRFGFRTFLADIGLLAFSPFLGAMWWAERFLAFKINYPVSLLNRGIARGQAVLHWAQFSHFHADSMTHIIKVYSRRFPTVAYTAFQVPNRELFARATDLLSQHLPSQAPVQLVPLHRSTILLWGYIGAYIALVAVAAFAGWVASWLIPLPLATTLVYGSFLFGLPSMDINTPLKSVKVEFLSEIFPGQFANQNKN